MTDRIGYLLIQLALGGSFSVLATNILVWVNVWSEQSNTQEREKVFKVCALISVIPYFVVCLSVADILFEVAKKLGWASQDFFGHGTPENEMQVIAGSGIVMFLLLVAAICDALSFHRHKAKYTARYLRNMHR